MWRIPLTQFDDRFSALLADLTAAFGSKPTPLLIVAVTSEFATTTKAMSELQKASEAKAVSIARQLTSALDNRVQVMPQGLGAASPLDHWQEPRVDIIWLQN